MTVLYRVIKDHYNCVQLQNDLDNILDCCAKSELKINSKKTVRVTFTGKTSTLQSSIWGYFYVKRELERAYDYVASEVYRMLGFLRHNSSLIPSSVTEILHCPYIRSILDYVSVVWDPHTVRLQTNWKECRT